ncbi:hypothetical protein IFM89_028973 [Coptis chinensis]|uniref:MADS-box domain-containing protein n=1 Tax=Coptis chinensis TaxID=261450 RepID=A0A835IGU8_9MAGN|nr:hypothetical protein IFM89_028973 [Coptis chinensis]
MYEKDGISREAVVNVVDSFPNQEATEIELDRPGDRNPGFFMGSSFNMIFIMFRYDFHLYRLSCDAGDIGGIKNLGTTLLKRRKDDQLTTFVPPKNSKTEISFVGYGETANCGSPTRISTTKPKPIKQTLCFLLSFLVHYYFFFSSCCSILEREIMGKRKIEIEKIDSKNKLQVTFSKRRKGLFSKAQQLCSLCNADIGIVVFSPSGKKLYSFSNSSSLDAIIDRYYNVNVVEKLDVQGWWQNIDTSKINSLDELRRVEMRLKNLKHDVLTRLEKLDGASTSSTMVLDQPSNFVANESEREDFVWPSLEEFEYILNIAEGSSGSNTEEDLAEFVGAEDVFFDVDDLIVATTSNEDDPYCESNNVDTYDAIEVSENCGPFSSSEFLDEDSEQIAALLSDLPVQHLF